MLSLPDFVLSLLQLVYFAVRYYFEGLVETRKQQEQDRKDTQAFERLIAAALTRMRWEAREDTDQTRRVEEQMKKEQKP